MLEKIIEQCHLVQYSLSMFLILLLVHYTYTCCHQLGKLQLSVVIFQPLYSMHLLLYRAVISQEHFIDLLMVTDIYKINTDKFVYKQKNGPPEIFNNIFKENNQIHSHNAQQTNNIHHKHIENKNGKITTENHGTIIWNSISIE